MNLFTELIRIEYNINQLLHKEDAKEYGFNEIKNNLIKEITNSDEEFKVLKKILNEFKLPLQINSEDIFKELGNQLKSIFEGEIYD